MIRKEPLLTFTNTRLASAAVHIAVAMVGVFRCQFVTVFAMRWLALWRSSFQVVAFIRGSAAKAATSLTIPNKKISPTKGMPLYAVCFRRVFSGKRVPSKGIYAPRNGFQMDRVNTRRLTAKMVNLQSYWNWADKPFVNNSMARTRRTLDFQSSIALGEIGSPQPTRNAFVRHVRVYRDFAKEASKKFAVNGKLVRIVNGHDLKSPFSLCLGDVRLQPCAAFSL